MMAIVAAAFILGLCGWALGQLFFPHHKLVWALSAALGVWGGVALVTSSEESKRNLEIYKTTCTQAGGVVIKAHLQGGKHHRDGPPICVNRDAFIEMGV